ncbi:ABC transporter permease [Bradyrhizobium sp. dw_78]|uniref:ABC transporter permease n=1 Tax=Bradyrhizobium sp. dw_78 TaxID=2719793 RepID=UPI001C4A6902|nr:ABC transporter permease [Bradyrhizobium sp. dw_78]
MELLFSQILNGLVIGQVYALIALGFTLVFGVANIINFAQGALFMLGAFLAFSGIAWFGLPLVPAALISVVLVAALGAVLERVVLRPLSGASAITPLLSTLAISMILDQAAEMIWTPEPQSFPSPLAESRIFIGDAFVTGTDAAIFGFGLLTAIGLMILLSRTWLGRALRATSEDRDAAAQMGIRTDSMRQYSFALAGALGALSGIFVALYFQSVFPQMGLPFALKGFAAALLGGLTSIPGAVVGGVVLGVAETLASGYLGDNYRDVVAFALLLLLLMFRPQGLLGDHRLEALGGASAAAGAAPSTSLLASAGGAAVRQRVIALPAWGFIVLGAALAPLPFLSSGGYLLQAVSYGLIFALLSASVSLVSGSIGILSIGHSAFFGIGAYAVAILARFYAWPAEASLIAAIVITSFVAMLAALPLLRLSGHTVALGTLAIGQIGYLVFLNWDTMTRGPLGIPNVPAPVLVLFDNIRLVRLPQKYWLVLALVSLGLFLAERFVGSEIGRVWRAIREDRLAAHTAGVPVRRYILTAFAVSGALAGLAGGLLAYLQTVVSPESFTVELSIVTVIMAVLGGLGNMTGAAVAGFALTILPELLRGFSDWRLIVYGLILLVVLRLRPQGLLGAR